ncbi:MAG: transcription-repair coupling factor [Bacteroidales bacterium]|nr:transcription-repair coupling factor [Bacteroidales bacterium]
MKSRLGDNSSRPAIAVDGLVGSSFALLASQTVQELNRLHFFIAESKEEAAYLYNDIERILEDKDRPLPLKLVHYLPSSFKRAHTSAELNNTNVKLRSELLHKLSNQEVPSIIVSYPEAVAELIVNQRYILDNTFRIQKDAEIPVDVFLQYLYDLEYQQEDFVVEPGQFAWRGSIFDIFSYSEEYPYRIELEGDRIDSIRFFNPETQLSICEKDEICVMPNISNMAVETQRVSLFDYLPDDTVLWMHSPQDVGAQIDALYKNTAKELESRPASKEPDEPLFLPVDDLLIQKRHFEKGWPKYAHVIVNAPPKTVTDLSIHFNIKPQNNFGKSFDYLFLEWIENYEKGVESVFLSESASQQERLQKIMEDLLEKYNRHNASEYNIRQLFTPLRYQLHEGFYDEARKVAIYTDHQFLEKQERVVLRDRYKKSEAFTIKEIYDLQPGDYVVHINFGVGIYQGLEKTEINGKVHEVIKLTYEGGDILYVSIHSLHKISKYVGKDGTAPKLHRLGSGTWERVKERTKKRAKALAVDLIKLYSARKARKGFAFSPDSYLQTELEASFIYEDTPDQIKTLEDVKKDMESSCPMDRLICGDVGFGKTEIAIRAAFKAVCDSKQVAVLVPTTVLALQHYNTFRDRLADMPCRVEYVNRFKTNKQIKATLKELAEGKIDILIGTHRLLSKDVVFKDLGLLVIDEEQKFGVGAKEKLRELRVSVDTLTMSATPIPRTLQFSLIGARDISVISTPPPNRLPIQTEVHVFDEEILREAIQFELDRHGQVFFVHNKIQDIQKLSGMVQRLCPTARVVVGHGQMDGDELEKVMTDFIEGRYDVLVSTTIVESGLDIVNANTMIVNDAQNFALNVLHQLRGRVGRNNQKAYCYLFTKPFEFLNSNAQKRLKAIEEFSEIGSGIQIALRDLDIRGAGDILGADQSGFINEMGYEMYQKILNEAIQEMRDEGSEELGEDKPADNSAILRRDCLLETDVEAMFPTDYVSSVSERMSLYKELEAIRDLEKLDEFKKKVVDIFGQMPAKTEELMLSVPLRLLAGDLHFEKVVLKNKTFMGHFAGGASSTYFQSEEFGRVLAFMQRNHPLIQLKEINHHLVFIVHNVPTIKAALHWLEKLNHAINSDK